MATRRRVLPAGSISYPQPHFDNIFFHCYNKYSMNQTINHFPLRSINVHQQADVV